MKHVKLTNIGRPPDRRERVVNTLRERIVSGRLKPGDRLPTHKELEEYFEAAPPTILDAMAVLREAGFIESRPRCGTFVAAHPPHLTRFALTFPWPVKLEVSQFARALSSEAGRLNSGNREFMVFHDICGHEDVEDYQLLLRHVNNDSLAGIVFGTTPNAFPASLEGLPLLTRPGLPRVAISTPSTEIAMPCVYGDRPSFLPRAFQALAGQGRRRLAILCLGGAIEGPPPFKAWRRLAGAHGLELKPQWVHAVQASTAWSAESLTHLLFNAHRAADRPDALVITDDNLVPAATAGLKASGIQISTCGKRCRTADVHVIAHANFPYPTLSAVPVTRLGYDVRKLFETCVERLEQQRRGETPPKTTLLPAMFEEEVSGRHAEVGSRYRTGRLCPEYKTPSNKGPSVSRI
jgi:DNA-binding LacI/PurR family transcriptional regulator